MTSILGAVHAHSDYSHDSLDSLERIRETCVERGMRWLALTEHAEDLDAEIFGEYARHCANLSDDRFSFVPGLEFRFASARGTHLLALGVREWMSPSSMLEFFDQAEERGAFTILAHPILCRYAPPEIVRERVRAIEVWNARYNGSRLPDPQAIDLYRDIAATRPALMATVGLDQHDCADDSGIRIGYDASWTSSPISVLFSGAFENLGRDLRFDAGASIGDDAMSSLRRRRRALDAMTGVRRLFRATGRRLAGD